MDSNTISQCLEAISPYAVSISLGVSVPDFLLVLMKDPALIISYLNNVIGYDKNFVQSRIKVNICFFKNMFLNN